MPDAQQILELSDFEGLLNETFVFSLEGVEHKAEGILVKAEPIQAGSFPGAERIPFMLEFKFPAETNLGQCTFQVETTKGDRLPPMFLVPRRQDAEGWYMDSTFN